MAVPAAMSYRMEYRSKSNTYAIRKVSVVNDQAQKRQLVELVGRDKFSREVLCQIATRARSAHAGRRRRGCGSLGQSGIEEMIFAFMET